MGTIEKIIDGLLKQSEDKSAQISKRYDEHSAWLAKELDQIKKLIHKSPREILSQNDVALNEVKVATLSAPSSSSSRHNSLEPVVVVDQRKNSASDADFFQRQKRKSPDLATGGLHSGCSPDQKRTSSDHEKLILGAGLPADLNKLKKEQLLTELENRGIVSFNMKALKKDLIDALKEAIIQEADAVEISSQAEVNEPQDIAIASSSSVSMLISDDESLSTQSAINPHDSNHDTEEAVVKEEGFVIASGDNPAPSPSMASSQQSKSPVRKGSLLAEFRTMVAQPMVKCDDETEDNRRARLESEFAARQRRHRDSQARKSNVNYDDIKQQLAEDMADAADDDNDDDAIDDGEVQKVLEVHLDRSDHPLSEPEERSRNSSILSTAEHNTWMEVSSPTRVSECKPNNLGNTAAATEAACNSFAMDVMAALNHSSDPCDSKAEATIAPAVTVASAVAELENAVAGNNSSVPGAPVRKPLNLMGGQSSFLDKPQTKPVYVAALEKAKQLKAAEELKSQQRKREMDIKIAGNVAAKPAAANVTNNATSVATAKTSTWDRLTSANSNNNIKPGAGPMPSTAPSSVSAPKANMTSTSAASGLKSLSSTAPAATSAQPTVQKKGILSSFLGKKAGFLGGSTGTSTAATATPAVTVTAVPMTSASTSSGDPSSNSGAAVQVQTSAPTATTAAAPVVFPTKTIQQQPVAAATMVTAPVAVVAAPLAAAPLSTPQPATMVAVVTPHQVKKEEREAAISSPKAASVNINSLSAIKSSSSKPVQSVLADITAAANQPSHVDEENIEDYPFDDDESDGSGSGTDDEEEQKNIPDWAKPQNLREALEKQYGIDGSVPMDPDLIFPEVQTCNLEEIFGCKGGVNRVYSKRTSSAKWEEDTLTLVERRTYRSQMGYKGAM